MRVWPCLAFLSAAPFGCGERASADPSRFVERFIRDARAGHLVAEDLDDELSRLLVRTELYARAAAAGSLDQAAALWRRTDLAARTAELRQALSQPSSASSLTLRPEPSPSAAQALADAIASELGGRCRFRNSDSAPMLARLRHSAQRAPAEIRASIARAADEVGKATQVTVVCDTGRVEVLVSRARGRSRVAMLTASR